MTSNSDSAWKDASTSIQDTSKPPITMEIVGKKISSNCVLRSVANVFFGGVLGFGYGLVVSKDPVMHDKMTDRQRLISEAKYFGRMSWPYSKRIAFVGFIFSATECIVEKVRGERDFVNAAVGGCVTGGAFTGKGGPKAACIGCATYGSLSAILDKCFGKHD